MKIVFVSNFFNHHQKFFSDKMRDCCEYAFVSTTPMPEERIKLGYSGEKEPEYVYRSYTNDDDYLKCQKLIDDADVVICGSAPQYMFSNRIKNKKIIFRYAEHPLKNGLEPMKYFPRLIKWHNRNPRKCPIYMLCASAYTASNYALFGLFKNKTYKWGYFPETKIYDLALLMEQKCPTDILWCGRFLDWKHPDDVVEVASRLKKEGYNFRLSMIGCGEFEDAVSRMIQKNDLSDHVVLLGSMSPEKIREYMEKSGIYLFTSDKREGWGAVLNEAMNSGCAVVASRDAGSTPFLVKDGENGFVYRFKDVDKLYQNVKYLLDNPNEQKRLGSAAYHTIVDLWNAETAAERFLQMAKKILDGEDTQTLFENGPCSKVTWQYKKSPIK